MHSNSLATVTACSPVISHWRLRLFSASNRYIFAVGLFFVGEPFLITGSAIKIGNSFGITGYNHFECDPYPAFLWFVLLLWVKPAVTKASAVYHNTESGFLIEAGDHPTVLPRRRK